MKPLSCKPLPVMIPHASRTTRVDTVAQASPATRSTAITAGGKPTAKSWAGTGATSGRKPAARFARDRGSGNYRATRPRRHRFLSQAPDAHPARAIRPRSLRQHRLCRRRVSRQARRPAGM
jgi:hypothetical protein